MLYLLDGFHSCNHYVGTFYSHCNSLSRITNMPKNKMEVDIMVLIYML